MTSLTINILLCLYLLANHVSSLTLELVSQENVIRPELERQSEYRFMVKIGIGTTPSQKTTTPYKEYFLHVDTSSPLSWLQCEGCKKCFKQQPTKPFPKTNSKSFHPILPSDKLCLTKQTDGKYCTYKIRYDENSYTAGILAKETLFLGTNFDNLVFGCGMEQNRMVYANNAQNKIAGVLGLGWGPLSFVTQIESISDGKFSHCFPPFKLGRHEKHKTRLRFGADAVSSKQNRMTTKLHLIGSNPFYYVELEGISFNGQRLNKIKEDVFRAKYTEGGVIINSGEMFTQLAKPAYDVLETKVDYYFAKLMYKTKVGSYNRRCYMKANTTRHRVPTISFHFKGSSGARMVLKPEALFTDLYNDSICLGIYPNDKNNMTIIGAHQLINHWFTFDTKNSQLSFHQENCYKNG
ncbi:hypothetical protein DH2020_000260 [Rehmannia glutinosa]|uniref:Peptidase A1 domain-containing protein n=1 Tax=Rehmannia glutinosa TaxID=99300 RepID=A0ABR0XWG0_REHGL